MKEGIYIDKMRRLAIVLLMLVLMSCNKMTKYKVENYFTDDQVDTFMVRKLMPYVAELPPTATDSLRFDEKFRAHFIRNLQYFPLKRYFITKDSLYYYLAWKQAPSIAGKESIAIGGSFKLDKNGSIYDFLEFFNTYKMPAHELEKKGDELFTEMVEKGSVDRYIGNNDYIEFPNADQTVYYDKRSIRWKLKSK